MKKLLTIFMSLLLLLAFSLPVMANAETGAKKSSQAQGAAWSANLGKASLYDMKKLLKPEQQTKLQEKLSQIEKKHNVRVVVITVPADSRTKTEQGIKQVADETLNKYFRDEAHNNGSIMLMICPEARKWAITTDNNMRQRITDDRGYPEIRKAVIEEIKDKKDDYNAAFNNYADKVDELLTYYEKEGEAWDPSNEFSILGLMQQV